MVRVCSCVCVCVFAGGGEGEGEGVWGGVVVIVTGGGDVLCCTGDGEGVTVEDVLSVGDTVRVEGGLVLDTGQADVQTCTPLQVRSEGQHAPVQL